MRQIADIDAVIFDMDGTLVDSEVLTEPTVRALCEELGIAAPVMDYSAFFGVSFAAIAQSLCERLPALADRRGVAQRLHNIYHEMLASDPPPPIIDAREFVVAAHALMPTAIVSSSGRARFGI